MIFDWDITHNILKNEIGKFLLKEKLTNQNLKGTVRVKIPYF